MTTVRELITDAMLEIGAADTSQAIAAEDAAAALRVLNRMVSSWANDELLIYTVDRQLFPLVALKQAYTIGVGGDFSTAYSVRPSQINMASVLVNGVELPIEILNDEQWRDVTLKATNSTFPLQMWANGNYPLNSLYFWPIPTAVNSVVLYVWGQVTAFATLDTVVSLPPGYEDMIVSNLAIRLCPSYQREPSKATVMLAARTMSDIKATNWEPTFRYVDSVLSGARSGIGQKSRGYVIE